MLTTPNGHVLAYLTRVGASAFIFNTSEKMKKTITLFGQTVELAFNLAAQIAWEDSTGKVFDISEIKSRKDTIALFMSCIIAGNPDTTITMDKLMFELSFDDMQVLDNAIGDLIREWYHLPATAQKEEPSQKSKKHAKRS